MKETQQDTPRSNRRLPTVDAVAGGWSDPDAVLARRLKTLREAAGLTQRQIASQMFATGFRIYPSTVAKIETGDRVATFGEATAFAGILGVSLADLAAEPADDQLAQALAEQAGRAQRFHEAVARRDAIAAQLRGAEAEASAAGDEFAKAATRVDEARARAARNDGTVTS